MHETFTIKTRKNLIIKLDNDISLSMDEVRSLIDYELLSESNNKLASQSIIKTKDLNNDEYYLITLNNGGYMLVSAISYEVLEFCPFVKLDYTITENDYYYPIIGGIKNINNEYYLLSNNEKLNNDSINNLKAFSLNLKNQIKEDLYNEINNKVALLEKISDNSMYSSSSGGGATGAEDWVIDVDKEVIHADVECDHSWFFKYNKNQFSYHNGGKNGICEYIAFLMLVEYNDFFRAKGYFSDEEINKYVKTVRGTSFLNSIPIVDDQFVYDIYLSNNKKETLNIDDLKHVCKNFLLNKPIKYNVSSAYWYFGNPKNDIKSGYPAMMCGNFPDIGGGRGDIPHNIIGYGYFTKGTNKDKFLTHYGWDNCTQCIVSRKVFSTGYTWVLKDKTENPEERYIFDINGELNSGVHVY